MELGNVHEVFQIGDRVKVNDLRFIYYGLTGTIIQIEDISYNTVPICTVELDEPWSLDDDVRPHKIKINVKGLEKIPRSGPDTYEITTGQRNGKAIAKVLKTIKEASELDAAIYSLDFLNKFTGGTDEMKKIDVEKIIFNEFKTIVFWNDGTKTIVSMSQEERDFDPEDAFRAAYTKKMFGTNSKIKRIIKEKSNIEQHQRIAKEKLKEEREKIDQDYDKYMKENYPWMYRREEKKEKSEASVRHEFKVGDGVVIASIRSPYFGRGGTITAVSQSYVDGSLQYTVEFYHPGNPGYSYTYAFPECQLAYDPAQALTEKGKKAADAWSVLWDMFFDCGDNDKEKKDDEK